MGYCYKNNVAGVSNKKWCNDVGGVSEENFKVPVYAYVNSKDLCSAVDRCLAAESENNNHHNCHCRCHRCRY